MTTVLKMLQRINRNLLRVAGWGVVMGMAAISIVIPYEVAGRYFLGSMPAWSGEVTTFSLVWVSMLGAAVGLPRGYQIGMTSLIEKLPERIGRFVKMLGHLITLAILSVLVIYGVDQTILNVNQTSSAMEISMAIPYTAIPAGALLMWLVTLEQALGVLTGAGEENSIRGS
ncbi:MAG: TRAP transporter small permease [Bacillota bacterium]